MRLFLGFLILSWASGLHAQSSRKLSLNGDWQFSLDPMRAGVNAGWNAPPMKGQGWDRVMVPHSWLADPRYPYIGVAWYRRTFAAPATSAGERVRLRFGAVFARAQVWINGVLLGQHEGGYTPFEFDITEALRVGENSLAVEVDNTWSTRTMPGARPGSSPADQVYPYFPWGGLHRDVTLEIVPSVHIANARILAEPDLRSGGAQLRITAWLRNSSSNDARVDLGCDCGARASGHVKAGEIAAIAMETMLPASKVQLWDLDHPRVSTLTLRIVGGQERAFSYGVRKFEVRGSELLLNGRPIRLGGANRAGDHPRFGLVEPQEVIEQDGRLLKEAGLDMARLQHYAIPERLLDWADRNGLLIVAEAAQWQFTPQQMDDPDLRADFQRQHREMMERDWNHPSVIAWSVGNEYASDTPAGLRWTRDMIAFTRSLDPSRPVTFADHRADRTDVPPAEEGSSLADFVMINVYGPAKLLAQRLDRLHERHPGKPILLSEYGIRVDQAKNEEERVTWFSEMLAVFRARPWIAGASVWSLNDYRSLYPGTNPAGFRPWGLVDEERRPRGSYRLLQREHRLLRLESLRLGKNGSELGVVIRGRRDFPSRRLEGATLTVDFGSGQVHKTEIPALEPGAAFEVTAPIPAKAGPRIRITGRQAGGWVTLEEERDLPK